MNRLFRKKAAVSLTLFLASWLLGWASSSGPERMTPAEEAQAPGLIKGRVVDGETREPLPGVTVSPNGTELRARSGEDGTYLLADVPLGFYVLSFEREGYYPETRTDVIVRSGRTTFLNVEMLSVRPIHKEISVTAEVFLPQPEQPVSSMAFNAEELRRDPGSAGDVSRALYVVPGIVRADDEANDLIVRGGSPMENGFYIDNIFLPNINHFPQQGASGGNISMLNMDFIDSLQISTGGFDASYGNRLSSIIDIEYREGNRERLNGQLNLSAIGYGAQFEGPIAGGKGSWMFSGNRSYLDLISKLLESDNPSDFFDLQGKAVYDIAPGDRLSLLAIGGSSRTKYDQGGREKFDYATAGLTWRHLWGGTGYSDMSLSISFLNGTENHFSESEGKLHEEYDYGNLWLTWRNINHFRLSPSLRLSLGAEAQNVRFRNWDDYHSIKNRLDGTSAAVFATAVVYPFANVSLSLGLRLDRLPFSERFHLSPRLSFHWELSRRLSLNGSFGLFVQQMPLFLIQQDRANAALRDPRARHVVLGLKYLLRGDMQLTLEAYDKLYTDFPMSQTYPYYFVIDDVNGDNDRFWDFGPLLDLGKAYSRGVELTVQKKLARDFYGLVHFTYYRACYRDLMGVWRNRLFDNRFILCVSGGYKPNRFWEFSARWTWSGNKAFTPVNVEKSILYGFPWIDYADIMSGHLSDYGNLSVRVDRRFQFKRSNLVVYAGAWNVFDHRNELYRFWDYYGNSYLSDYMWGVIPYLGLEFEF
jgi:hypothetical protein